MLINQSQKFFILALTLALASYLLGLSFFSFNGIADDAGFFLRYADNFLLGEFWVWNQGEAPIWGASAPLYPLILAIPRALGATARDAALWSGIALTLSSLSIIFFSVTARFGVLAASGLSLMLITNPDFVYFSYCGLETPLTLLLLSLTLRSLTHTTNQTYLGVLAGFLMIQKFDLIPAGILLLLAQGVKLQHVPTKAIFTAVILGASWYLFAWLYFGFPLPNSLLTKLLFQNDLPHIIDKTWFTKLTLFNYFQVVISAVALLSFRNRDNRPFLLFFGGLILTHCIVYSIKPPFEPYDWYGIPTIFSVAVLSMLGLVELCKSKKNQSAITIACSAIFITSLLLVTLFTFSDRANQRSHFLEAMNDWSKAGTWVNQNTPPHYKVFTMWGNPAYFSNRYVYDGSFLNMKYDPENIVQKKQPEILILAIEPGSEINKPRFPYLEKNNILNYTVVKTILDFAILMRKDLL